MQLCSPRDRFVAFAFAAADLLVETDEHGVITFAAGAARQFAACSSDQLAGRGLDEIIHRRDHRLLALMIGDAPAGGRNGPVTIANRSGSATASLSLFKLGGGRLHFTIGSADNGAGRPAWALRDEETGLLLPMAFEQLAEQQLVRSLELDSTLEMSLLRIVQIHAPDGDADHAAFRDLYEHVAVLLRMLSVGGDAATMIAPGRFAVLHADDGSGPQIRERVAAVLDNANLNDDLSLQSRSLTLSDRTLPPSQACDALRHVLRGLGDRNATQITAESLTEALDQKVAHTLARVKSAKSQIEQQQFHIVYQPIVALQTCDLHHYEALSRFKDGASPYEFVTFAEHVGFVAEFDLSVARMVLDELACLADRGNRPLIAVNLSARSLESDRFIEALRKLCRSSYPQSGQLLFEITESCEIRDLARADAVLQQLRQDGFPVCLDDFGAGAAALHYIRALTVDHVKLDGDYVRRMLVSDRDSSILSSMISLCSELGVSTIAEMVESDEQHAALRTLGATYGQGWLFGRAEPLLPPGTRQKRPTERARRRGRTETWA